MEHRRITRHRFPEAVYLAAQAVVDDDPTLSAKAIADRLAENDALDPRRLPAPTTVREWLRTGVLVVQSDYWTVTGSSGDEARLVLPAIAFLVVKTRRRHPRLTISRARWIAKLRTIDPEMPVGAALVLSRLYEAHVRLGVDTSEVDRYLALADWNEWGEDGSHPPIDQVWLSEAGRSALRG